MKILIHLLFLLLFISCAGKEEYVTVKIKLACIPSIYFNQLDDVLLTNTLSDIDGKAKKKEWLTALISPNRVYAKDLKRNADDYFYVDNVEKDEYLLFYIQGTTNGSSYSGFKRLVNYSESKADTVETEICIQSNYRIVQ